MTSALLDIKREYTEHLSDILSDGIMAYFLSMYDSLLKTRGRNHILQAFQEQLADIPNWTSMRIRDVYETVKKRSKCGYLGDLLKTVLIVNVKIWTATHEQTHGKAPKIKVRVPSVENFIHSVCLAAARVFWKKPHLFYQDLKSLERQHNLVQAEDIVAQCVRKTVRAFLPLDELMAQMPAIQPAQHEKDSRSTSTSSASTASTASDSDSESESDAEESFEESEESSSISESPTEAEKPIVAITKPTNEHSESESEQEPESKSESETETESEPEHEPEPRSESDSEDPAPQPPNQSFQRASEMITEAPESDTIDDEASESSEGSEVIPLFEAPSAKAEINQEIQPITDPFKIQTFRVKEESICKQVDVSSPVKVPREDVQCQKGSEPEREPDNQAEQSHEEELPEVQTKKIIPLPTMLLNKAKIRRPKLSKEAIHRQTLRTADGSFF